MLAAVMDKPSHGGDPGPELRSAVAPPPPLCAASRAAEEEEAMGERPGGGTHPFHPHLVGQQSPDHPHFREAGKCSLLAQRKRACDSHVSHTSHRTFLSPSTQPPVPLPTSSRLGRCPGPISECEGRLTILTLCSCSPVSWVHDTCFLLFLSSCCP